MGEYERLKVQKEEILAKQEKRLMMGIKIVRADSKSWYSKEIGNVFGVIRIRETDGAFVVKQGKIIDHFVLKEDCEVIQ